MASDRIIRILQVGMSPYYGGTEAFLMSQYREIDKSKIQFDFLNVYDEKIACQDEIEKSGGKIYYLDMARHRGLNTYYKNLDLFFAENADKFDAVHCNFQSLINTDVLKYAKKYGIKVRIAHAHNSGYGTPPSKKQKLIIAFNRKTLGLYATHYFACSSLAAQWMFGREAIVIHNAIDSDKFVFSEHKRMEMRRKLELNNAFAVIFVGRLDPQKNPIFLLDIFSEIKRNRSDSKLIIVGDGILREQMMSRMAQLQISNDVIMLGSRRDVNDLLQAADAFLLPSLFEGLGIVLIEAQAAGLKTYTSKDVVPNDAKITDLLEFISLDRSAKEWADIITGNTSNHRIHTKSKICAAGYDNHLNAKNLERLYLQLLGEKKQK